jgi:Fe-coproporphyrin III synthase
MCDIWKREVRAEFAASDLERHRDSLRALGVRQVVFTGGEPLLHSHLHALCGFFREEAIRLTLLTTGLLLEERAADVCALFDEVIVSLDGPEAIHNGIRRVKDAFRLLDAGIRAVRAVRPQLAVTARCTVQRANHAHLRETVAAAKLLRLNSISFLAADLDSQAFNRALVWPLPRQNQIALSADDIETLQYEIESMIGDYALEIASGFIAERPEKLRRIVRHFQAHLGAASYESPRCNAPWISAVVEVDGTVRPCFFHRPVGSLNSATLEELLNGEEALAFRDTLDVARNLVCQRCVCSLHRSDASETQ